MANRKLLTMNGAQLQIAASAILVLLVGILVSFSWSFGQSSVKYSFQIEPEDAFPDSTLPAIVRSDEEDWGESPLTSVSVDLNGDGVKEKFIPNTFLRGSGLCPWVLLDTKHKRVIGHIDALVLFVQKAKKGGYATIEAFTKMGGDHEFVSFYVFNGQEYKESKSLELREGQSDKYFEERKAVPHPRELRPGQ